MSKKVIVAFIALLAPAQSAFAKEYLTSVTSEVYRTEGTPSQIANRASICMSQHLVPGSVNADLFISRDLEGGILVARSAVEYGSLPRWKIRSVFTFQAREGRFRVEQTNLERFNDQFNVGWNPIGKWTGSQWRGAEKAFTESASVVAQCVMKQQSQRDDW